MMCTQCREVSGQHFAKQFEWISMHKQCRNGILKNQQENMKNEDDSDNFNKHHQDRIYLSRMCHVEEYAEDIKR